MGESIEVRFRNDSWRKEGVSERTTALVDSELATLFTYARRWAKDADRHDSCDLTFSAMLAAMVAQDLPLCNWLRRYFDALGIPSADITKGRAYPDDALYPTRPDGDHYLATTRSFREAFQKAAELCEMTSDGPPIAVRHFMAAYAVCPGYHLRDFRAYRIDRREWCLRLSDELIERFPGEAVGWEHYRTMAPPLLPLAFDNDTPDGQDHLHLEREVSAFSRLIAARSTSTPLSIGVFGAWGSGKSFFMRRTRDRVAMIAKEAASKGRASEHHARIAQVEFNAWNYSETDIISSLVDHIFRNLRIDVADEDDETLRHRGEELMRVLTASEERLESTRTDTSDAEQRLREAEDQLADAQASLPNSVREANLVLGAAEFEEHDAERRLASARDELDAAIRAGRARAEVTTLLAEISDETTNAELQDAVGGLVGLVSDARSARSRWRPIAIGVALLVLTIAFATLADSRVWAQALSVMSAIGAFATIARSWIAKLSQIADRGDRYLAERQRVIDDAGQRVATRFEDEISGLEHDVETRRVATAAARERLAESARLAGETELLHSRQGELAAARSAREEAQRGVAEARLAIEGNDIDSLLREFLDDRHDSNDYRAKLGVFSHVRSDFERLSKLITRSTNEYYKRDSSPPAVSRIVLYIDDLDRCPEQKVIEVLRAVHLLLAFPLFVCVVAVDPRWLSTCLEQAPGISSDSSSLDSAFGRTGEAADYIEKIFQVPLWLRPVPTDQRAALVRSWLDEPKASVDTEQPPLTRAELDFLDALRPMLDGNPRTLKRLANTYRLVKTALSDVEFRTFTVEGPTPSSSGACAPYRICMTQLAVLSADRSRAIAMIESLDSERSAESVGAWLKEFMKTDPDLATFLSVTLDHVDNIELGVFRTWLERTRRYSFYL